MDKSQFWQLIEQSRSGKDGCEDQAQKLQNSLSLLSAQEIIEYDKIWTELHFESYCWDLWAVCYIVHGGASDDSFDYFRFWLVGQGREYYEAAMKDAERAADALEPEDVAECEDIDYVARTAYKEKVGEELPTFDYHQARPDEPLGDNWQEEDLPTLYPALWEKFSFEL